MNNPRLSVLVPAIVERVGDKLTVLLDHLQGQAAGRPVEILSFVDNCKRTIGEKRDALVQLSRGDYVIFVDDDDWVANNYVHALLELADVNADVICVTSRCFIDDDPSFLVRFDLHHKDNEQAHKVDGVPQDLTRPPWHVCAWRGEIARRHHFPATNYGEDWAWAKKCNADAETQARIGQDIHVYRFNSQVSRAIP